ncbi:MAG TPA: TspO/MBR family protein [Miltoncostaea sp.]|nr:TspO/MBR family protein [Miltoncostaea sp.]
MRSLALLAGSALAVGTAAAVGGLAAGRAAPGYYETLDRPSWSPPAGVFAPVWSVLYVSMATAAWLVAREGLERRDVRLALGLFGAQRPGLAAADIVALLAVLAATVAAFWRVRPAAGALMVPYLAWVAFATALNLAIAR